MSSILDKTSIRQAALPITVEQYHRLSELGILAEDTELLEGVIVARMTKSPLHTYVVSLLAEWLSAALGADYHLRKEEPLTLADSEPEPDLAVVRGSARDYRAAHPATAELVIEVAIATVELDRDKAEVYAAARVPEYWIVLPEQRAVEIYREAAPGGYGQRVVSSDPAAEIRPQCLPHAGLRLASLFT